MYINLAGKKVLRLGLGTYQFGISRNKAQEEKKVFDRALELGIAVVDTATLYKNEAFLGELIQGRRDKVFLISKVLPSEASLRGTKTALERSLRDLKTSYLDLYFLHWKGSYPLEETIEALSSLKKEGKIRSWGLSNVDVPEIKALGETVLDCEAVQVLYNPQYRGIEYDFFPYAEKANLKIMAYCPLGEGSTTLLNHPGLQEIAAKHQVSTAAVLIAFSLRKPYLISIPKSSSVAHLEDNFTGLSFKLDDEDEAKIDSLFKKPISKTALSVI